MALAQTVNDKHANDSVAGTRNRFFEESVRTSDPELFEALRGELKRQQDQIELIASENIVSRAVLEAQGSVLTNKYAEGYPGKRYYNGCEYVDIAEKLAIDRACKLFGCTYANVQPNSGSQANQAVFMAVMKPGDTFMGLDLAAGGHLTHGASVNQSGKWFNVVSYGVKRDTHLIDYDQMEKLAHEHKPKLIIAGGSAYPRTIDFARFRKVADAVGAVFMVDMAHYAGLIAGGVYPSPFPHAHVATTTTHKTLRGPRGGMILSNDPELGKKFNSAIFPGIQGGPLMHVIAAKAVAFGEALQPSFKTYAQNVLDNARVLADTLVSHGFGVVSGGTDSHIVLVDLTSKNITGKDATTALENAGMTSNKNGIPFDTKPPTVTSGVRLGSPAATTRGFTKAEFKQIANWIAETVATLAQNPDGNNLVEAKVKAEVKALCDRFPIYQAETR
ncbi:MAG: serine hydroxymethyltransferase [Alphaproteobacteria bacterium]|nr:serine hydroxymethyltransferase [Alphaproteobacteria bacterium]